MVLTVQRDVYDSHSDSISENICDIFVDNGDIANPQTTGSCVIIGRDTVRIGTSRKYTATFTEPSGAIVPIERPVWSVIAPDGVAYRTLDGECTITIPLKEDYVGETIVITVSDEDNIFGSFEKKVQVITVG